MPRPWKPRVYLQPSLPECPQVQCICEMTGHEPAAVVAALQSFWLEAQVRCGEGGRLQRKTPAWVDMMARLAGLAEAMVAVDWLRVDGADLVVPGFDAWVSKAAVRRIENAEAARRRRAGQGGYAGDELRSNATFGNVAKPGPTSAEQSAQPAQRRARSERLACPLFGRFWAAYPKKVSRAQAEAAWRKLTVTEELLVAMLAAVQRQATSEQWVKDNGQYIPYPATWINQRRWEDEPGRPAGAGPGVRGGARVHAQDGEYGRKRFEPVPDTPLPPDAQPTLF